MLLWGDTCLPLESFSLSVLLELLLLVGVRLVPEPLLRRLFGRPMLAALLASWAEHAKIDISTWTHFQKYF